MEAELACDLLHKVVSEILQEAAFIFTEETEEHPFWGEELIEVSLGFAGPEKGRLLLVAQSDFGSVLAANLLGLEPEDPENLAKGEAALCEILNIISGAYLEERYGKNQRCPIGIPKAQRISLADYKKKIKSAEYSISLVDDEDNRIDVCTFIES